MNICMTRVGCAVCTYTAKVQRSIFGCNITPDILLDMCVDSCGVTGRWHWRHHLRHNCHLHIGDVFSNCWKRKLVAVNLTRKMTAATAAGPRQVLIMMMTSLCEHCFFRFCCCIPLRDEEYYSVAFVCLSLCPMPVANWRKNWLLILKWR